jgi:hypothetical protein
MKDWMLDVMFLLAFIAFAALLVWSLTETPPKGYPTDEPFLTTVM